MLPRGESTSAQKLDQAEVDRINVAIAQKYGGAGIWHTPTFFVGRAVERIRLDQGEMVVPQVREPIEPHMYHVRSAGVHDRHLHGAGS